MLTNTRKDIKERVSVDRQHGRSEEPRKVMRGRAYGETQGTMGQG